MKLDISLCRQYLKMPAFHWRQAQAALDVIGDHERGNELLQNIQEAFFDSRDPEKASILLEKLQNYVISYAPKHQDAVFSAVFGLFLPQLLNSLRAECGDEQIVEDTLLDYSIWAEAFESETGRTGVSEYRWLAILYAQKIFRIGRLQYECSIYKEPYYAFECRDSGEMLLMACADIPVDQSGKPADTEMRAFLTAFEQDEDTFRGHPVDPCTGVILPEQKSWRRETLALVLAPDMPVLNIHIPAAGSLKPELVEDSLKRAHMFFDRKNVPARVGICESWLLDPALEAYGADCANILAFQKRFARYPLLHACSDARVRIYGRKYERTPLVELPENTSLQRGYKRFCLNGGVPCNTGGVLLLHETRWE